MKYILHGKPSPKRLDFLKSRYVPRDAQIKMEQSPEEGSISISSQTAFSQVNIPEGFTGNILKVYSPQTSSYQTILEPLSEISSKGSSAKDDYCNADSYYVTEISSLSPNFLSIYNEISSSQMTRSISSENVVYAQESSFCNNTNLEEAYLPSLLSVPQKLFYMCTRLKHVKLDSVQKFVGTAFQTNSLLQTIDFGKTMETPPYIMNLSPSSLIKVFIHNGANVSCYVPKSILTDFQNDSQWGQITNITYIGQ